MTAVNTEAGELLDTAAAERRAERISLRLDSIADNYAAVMPMIRDAIEKRDDLALGYRSPGEYVSDRFGGALQRLGMEVRREVVRELTEAGMSTRSIAPVVGVSNFTVHQDQAAVRDLTPADDDEALAAKFDHDRGYDRPPRERAGASEPIPLAGPPIIGNDGKAYPRRARQIQRDDAEVLLNRVHLLADQAAREVAKLTPEQIVRVKPKADLWTVGLGESLETLQGLLTSLTEEK